MINMSNIDHRNMEKPEEEQQINDSEENVVDKYDFILH